MAFEKYIFPSATLGEPRMSLHLFRAILGEYIAGKITKTQARAAIEQHLGLVLTTNEVNDLVSVMTAIDGETGFLNKMVKAEDLYRVLVIAEFSSEVTLYNTKAKLKARLSWI